jgi:membrane-bound lytic murein transglycosylase F
MSFDTSAKEFTRKGLLIFLIIFLLCSVAYLIKSYAKPGDDDDVIIFYEPGPDLEEIKKRGKLIAATDNSSIGYFIYKGEPMGFEYEMLKNLAKHLEVELEVKVVKDINTILELLLNNEVDILAANLTITKERARKVNFSYPLLLTKQVLVQRKPDNWRKQSQEEIEKQLVRNPVDLSEKQVYVRRESSFYSRLLHLADEIGSKIYIMEAPGNMDTELLISKVANKEIDFTVADENIALINQTYYPNIDIKTAISLPQKIAWAVRKDSDQLLIAINDWLKDPQNKKKLKFIYNKYYKNPKQANIRAESSYFSMSGGQISQYDDLIKKYSEKIGWDWRLVAALIAQESRFNHEAESWMGASGLMQLMPATYAHFLSDSVEITPELSIKAGTSYLRNREEYWKKYIFDPNERIKFILASYNVGMGHVIDARRLAIKHNRNPNQWDDNVEYFLSKKSLPEFYNDPVVKHGYCRGQEPVKFVREILKRYNHYKNLIENSAENETFAKE